MWQLPEYPATAERITRICCAAGIAAMSGCLSLRRDMKPADHEWADRTDFREFFPAPDDMMVNREILSNEEKVALGILYEQFSCYGKEVRK